MYTDLTNTIDNANILLRAVIRGRVLDFYELSVEESVTDFAANYNFLIYALFAIWQAPAYFVAHVLHRNYMSWPWTLLWSKLLVVLFSAAVAYFMYKIVLLLAKDKKRAAFAVCLFYSSTMVLYPVFICGQLDVISMTFILMGVYRYLKEDIRGFWLSFVFAVPFKMFALILALPLILIKQKNLLKAGLMWISMTSLLVIENIVFQGSPIHYWALKAQSDDAIKALLGSHIMLGRPLVIFLAIYFCLVLYAWMKKAVKGQTIVYMGFILWGSFVCFSKINSYWILLLVPFMIMSICVSNRFILHTSFLETLSGLFYFLNILCANTYPLKDGLLVKRLFLPRLMSLPDSGHLKYDALFNVIAQNDWGRYTALFSTAFTFTVLAVLFLTSERMQDKRIEYDTEKEGNYTKVILAFRPVVIIFIVGLILYGSTASTNSVAFNTRGAKSSIASVDLISSSQHSTVAQKIIFNEDRKLDTLILKFNNTRVLRSNMALLKIDLVKVKTGKSIFSNVIAGSAISDKQDLSIDLKNTPVEKGEVYEIRLSGRQGNSWYFSREHLYPYFVTASDNKLSPVEIDGIPQTDSLYFQIR